MLSTAYKVSAMLEQLCTLHYALFECGITPKTYYNWIEQKTNLEFLHIIEQGLEKRKNKLFQIAILGVVKLDGKEKKISPNGAMWALARMHPTEFSENYIVKKLEKDKEQESLEKFGVTTPPTTIIYCEKKDDERKSK